ncbi:hypothetical protein ACFCW4_02720 [Streptomyces virginiae]|uniref:hypothetical protein n=1 Tax=Streptomyces virginiae TaxID=1961 RepID=UPI0035DB0844
MTEPDALPRLTPNPDGGWLLHLPDVTHLDTQVWSVDIGLTDEGLAALRTLLAGQPEHCVHSRAMHDQHHRTPVDDCPWCSGGTTHLDPGDLL